MQRARGLGKMYARGVELKQRRRPVVYKFDSDQSETTHEELTQGKTGESEKSSS
jgi:hypothetical protein